ncbi:MAG: hypothetical protein ACKO96_15345, partial [Flammeovirgaceae bacterium]
MMAIVANLAFQNNFSSICFLFTLLLNSDLIVFMNKPQAKPYIYQIAPYKQGKSASNPDVRPIKLSSNESPYGASPKAISAYKTAS